VTGPKTNEGGTVAGERVGTRATAKYLRGSATKARQVLDLIRGLDVQRAEDVLRFTDREMGAVIRKVLASAVANAEHNDSQGRDELFVVSLFRTFNPAYPFWNLQVIWAIGVSMIALAAMTQLSERALLATGLVIVGAHDLLDSVHVAGDGVAAFLWALLHDRRVFACGHATVRVSYPLLPWIGTMALGYACGRIHLAGWDTHERRRSLAEDREIGVGVEGRMQGVHRRIALERAPTGQQFIQHAAE